MGIVLGILVEVGGGMPLGALVVKCFRPLALLEKDSFWGCCGGN